MIIHKDPIQKPVTPLGSPKDVVEFCKIQILPPLIKYANQNYILIGISSDYNSGELYYASLLTNNNLIEITLEELLHKSNSGEIGTFYNKIRYSEYEAKEAANKLKVPYQIYVDRLDEAQKFKTYNKKRDFDPSKNSILSLIRTREDGVLLYGLTENVESTMTLYTNVLTINNMLEAGKIIDFKELCE